MGICNLREILKKAREERYAVGAFNILDYCSMRAVVESAVELKAPVIIQTSVKTVKFWGYSEIISWYKQLAGKADVPIAIHLDHCKELNIIEKCIEAGWTSVMIDASNKPFEENLSLTSLAVNMALPRNVTVEAELGEILGVEDDASVKAKDARLPDPEKAVLFCRRLSLDVFAPAIGTAHGLYKGEPQIAFELLKEIAERTVLPIALHGGTGLSDNVFLKAISLGCAKINISTMLKHSFINGFMEHGKKHSDDYNPLNYLQAQLDALKKPVKEKILLFGSRGKG